jgi:muramoyltetrapeptide carboxypeptidase LdcA involved in peptidoglycan recycling
MTRFPHPLVPGDRIAVTSPPSGRPIRRRQRRLGRTPAEDRPDLTQPEAVEDALGGLGIPVVAEMDIGHTQPFLPLVNGASARVVVRDGVREVTQRIG